MGLLLVCLLILFAGLVLVQAWTLWYLRREVARLEFRLGEALDDEDLIEFQERLQALLEEAKAASTRLAQGAEERREALEKALEKARLAEKSLALRLVAKSASEAAPKPKVDSAAKRAKAVSGPKGASPKPAAAAAPAPVKPAHRAAPKRSEAPAAPVPLRPEALPARHQRIYELADQGLDVESIARQSGLLAGEVDLILSLRRRPGA